MPDAVFGVEHPAHGHDRRARPRKPTNRPDRRNPSVTARRLPHGLSRLRARRHHRKVDSGGLVPCAAGRNGRRRKWPTVHSPESMANHDCRCERRGPINVSISNDDLGSRGHDGRARAARGRRHRRRARRPHRGLRAHEGSVTRPTVTILESDTVVGGISQTVRARRLALRHRRPPLLHQGDGRRRALGRDPRAGDDARPAPPEPHPLPRQALRLPARPDERAAQPRPGRGGALRRCRTSGRGSTRRRTRTTSKASTPPASAGGSTGTSSRRTPRRCGASRVASSPPTGARSA